MKTIGLTILFDGAEVAVAPVGAPGSEIDLNERLAQFCAAVAADHNLCACIAGLHEHRAGECARR
ncbi:MAG: hypothetical protein WEG40_13355 [Candidatus Rokuibacteriota bacterium]